MWRNRPLFKEVAKETSLKMIYRKINNCRKIKKKYLHVTSHVSICSHVSPTIGTKISNLVCMCVFLVE